MKKISKILFGLSSVALMSCGASSQGFYGKTFTYKNALCYNINSVDEDFGKSFADVIQEQMAADNINWESTGFVASSFLVSIITPFADHSSYSAMIASMESMAKATFDTMLRDFKLEVSAYADRKATITTAAGTNTYKVVGYNNDTEDDIYLTMYDNSENEVGHIEIPTEVGMSIKNGKYDCIEVEYGAILNRVKCQVSFKEYVSSYSGITWNVYGKIAN